MNEEGDGLMRILQRNRRWAAPIVALVAVAAMVGLLPHFGFTSAAKAPIWTERASAQAVQVQAPDWVRLSKEAKPAVVNISSKLNAESAMPPQLRGRPDDRSMEDFFKRFFDEGPRRPVRAGGSGVILNANGFIVTNNHVVENAADIQVKLDDGRELPAKVVGRDAKTDLALLKIDATGLPVIPLGDSTALQVGEPVMAIGNPFGLEQTVTTGIVSATGRVIGSGPYDNFIQTDASINPGNSGGPLINARGEVVGINTAIFSRNGGSVGIGFAVPSSLAKTVITQLADHGTVERGWLGVSIQPLTKELAASFKHGDTSGALVSAVMEGSPADKAGVKAGDVIVEFNGKKVAKATDLPGLVADVPVGKDVPIVVVREGVQQRLNAHIAKLEDESHAKVAAESDGKGKLGLSVQPVTPPVARELGLKVKEGVLVRDVVEGGRAAEAGIRAGDVIVEVDRRPVRTIEDFKARLDKQAKDEPVVMLVNRDGQTMYVAIPAA
jgi:serine protease Do